MDVHYYPPTSFHFSVEFLFPDGAKEPSLLGSKDVLFQSVSGLNAEIQTENLLEGGENRFEHVLPVRSKYTDLVLKRGLLQDSGVIQWCRQAIESFQIVPININVNLLDEEHNPLIVWKITHAWPKKWSVTDLNAEQSALLIETLELNYCFFSVEHSQPDT